MNSLYRNRMIVAAVLAVITGAARAAEPPTPADAAQALRKAVTFFRGLAAGHGGYVWRYSADLAQREGEAQTTPTQAWVQPPGTPSVGEAFLDAFEATGDAFYLGAARETGRALVRGQLRSGGWFYSIEFDPEQRRRVAYRDGPKLGKQAIKSTLDDDTTQSAARFLARLDRALKFQDAPIHEAARYAVDALVGVQYPNGGWSHWWETLPGEPPRWQPGRTAKAGPYPVIPASYPDAWPRTWPNDWTGCYVLNDNLVADGIDTLLVAAEVYGEKRYRAAAEKAGKFLLLAQMPDPQPAWAQQYDRAMHPVWSRKFEPPAISSWESQSAMEALLTLYRRTGDKAFLGPIPRALAYLRKSALADGRLARFYELKTNQPLYFTRDYRLTYRSDDLPTHYGFIQPSRLDTIEAEYRRLVQHPPARFPAPAPPEAALPAAELAARVRTLINTLDARGAWVEPGRLKSAAKGTPTGVVQSQTFAENVRTLCRFLSRRYR